MSQNEHQKLQQMIAGAASIVIIQADNPDADSLGSALGLEQILGKMGKMVHLYCGVGIPTYLQYLPGHDRVTSELPAKFDLSIIVDTSTQTLLQKLNDSGQKGWVASKPSVVLDHHGTSENDIEFATVAINDPKVSSTGELIYKLSKELGWPVDRIAGECLLTAILGDTQGLSNDLATPGTYRIVAELLELEVNRPKLEELRREHAKMDPAIFKYKARLIERTKFELDGKLALVTVPQVEINQYSPLHNPAPLIQSDMLMTSGVGVALAFKEYDDGKILCSIRCNAGYPVAAQLAEHFGGGGHPYASGFKITSGRPLNEVKSECIQKISELLENLNKEPADETIRHTVS